MTIVSSIASRSASWIKLATQPQKGTVAYGLAVLLGVAFYFLTYAQPLRFLSGESGFFEVGDAPQHVTGWQLYAQDRWGWPLLVTRLIDPPDGVNVALTDSIPLAAIIFKVLYPILPENFHYFGIWHLVSKIGQAVGGAFLIRSLGQRDWLSAIVAAAMMLLWPPSLARITHTSLTTHGILLFSAGIYFRALRHDWCIARATLTFAILAVVSLLIHPYFLAMVFPLLLAFAGDRWLQGRGLADSAVIVTGVATVLACTAVLLGYASGGTGYSDGFSQYSMNMLSPFCGGLLLHCGFRDAIGAHWFEGYNYLGFGAFTFFFTAVITSSRRNMLIWVIKHPTLLLVLVLLTIYSLSNRIFVGDRELVSYPLFPIYDQLAEIFRASGRFFWLVGYVLFFVAMAGVLKLRPAIALPVVVIALALQWIDTGALRAQVTDLTNPQKPFDYSGWMALKDRIDHVQISPTHGCAGIDNMHYLYFQIVAARLGASINTGYLARNSDRCKSPENMVHQPRTLYVSMEPVRGQPAPHQFEQGIKAGICTRWPDWGGLILCADTISREEWAGINRDLVFE